MRRIVFFIVTLFIMGGIVMAQGQRDNKKVDPKARAEQMTERMVKVYSLDDTQKKQLMELNMTQVEKMGDRTSSMRSEKKANREAYDIQLQKIMTKDQYDSYIKKQAEQNQNQKRDRKRK